MLIEKKKVTELLPADYNPRKDLKPGDPEYEKLKRSIEQFGYVGSSAIIRLPLFSYILILLQVNVFRIVHTLFVLSSSIDYLYLQLIHYYNRMPLHFLQHLSHVLSRLQNSAML